MLWTEALRAFSLSVPGAAVSEICNQSPVITVCFVLFFLTNNCKAIKFGKGEEGGSMAGHEEGNCHPQYLAMLNWCYITCEFRLPKHFILIHGNYASISVFVPFICCWHWISGIMCHGWERLEKSIKRFHKESDFSEKCTKKILVHSND